MSETGHTFSLEIRDSKCIEVKYYAQGHIAPNVKLKTKIQVSNPSELFLSSFLKLSAPLVLSPDKLVKRIMFYLQKAAKHRQIYYKDILK